MRIKEVIWIKEFSEKIEQKHRVSENEVDEVFAKQPPVRRVRRGNIEGEISMEPPAKLIAVVT